MLLYITLASLVNCYRDKLNFACNNFYFLSGGNVNVLKGINKSYPLTFVSFSDSWFFIDTTWVLLPWSAHTALSFLLLSKIPKIKTTIVSEKLYFKTKCRIIFQSTITSICLLMNFLGFRFRTCLPGMFVDWVCQSSAVICVWQIVSI